VPVRLGRMQVAYRETLSMPAEGNVVYEKMAGTKRMWARVGLRVEPLSPGEGGEGAGETLTSNAPCYLDLEDDAHIRCRVSVGGDAGGGAAGDAGDGLKDMPPPLADALREGIEAAFGRGPVLGYPLVGLRVEVVENECEINADTSPAAIRAAVARAMDQCLRDGGGQLLEPVMAVEVAVPDSYVGDVLNDLSSQRRAHIKEVIAGAASSAASSSSSPGGSVAGKALVRADVPLKSMVGYSTALRSKTAGEGSFSMEFAQYAPVPAAVQRAIVADPFSA
jgi:elongation factor G